jgi:hypothetical protein
MDVKRRIILSRVVENQMLCRIDLCTVLFRSELTHEPCVEYRMGIAYDNDIVLCSSICSIR